MLIIRFQTPVFFLGRSFLLLGSRKIKKVGGIWFPGTFKMPVMEISRVYQKERTFCPHPDPAGCSYYNQFAGTDEYGKFNTLCTPYRLILKCATLFVINRISSLVLPGGIA
jgi:hypothetical protein